MASDHLKHAIPWSLWRAVWDPVTSKYFRGMQMPVDTDDAGVGQQVSSICDA